MRPSKDLWCFLLGVLQGVKLVCRLTMFDYLCVNAMVGLDLSKMMKN